jgi:hypothetical protein
METLPVDEVLYLIDWKGFLLVNEILYLTESKEILPVGWEQLSPPPPLAWGWFDEPTTKKQKIEIKLDGQLPSLVIQLEEGVRTLNRHLTTCDTHTNCFQNRLHKLPILSAPPPSSSLVENRTTFLPTKLGESFPLFLSFHSFLIYFNSSVRFLLSSLLDSGCTYRENHTTYLPTELALTQFLIHRFSPGILSVSVCDYLYDQ